MVWDAYYGDWHRVLTWYADCPAIWREWLNEAAYWTLTIDRNCLVTFCDYQQPILTPPVDCCNQYQAESLGSSGLEIIMPADGWYGPACNVEGYGPYGNELTLVSTP